MPLFIFAFTLTLFPSKTKAFQFTRETTASARSLAMGRAGVAAEIGPYAAFYNPANLGSKDMQGNLQLINIAMEIPSASPLAFTSGVSSLSSLAADAIKDPGTALGGRISAFPNFFVGGFTFGVLYEQNRAAYYNSGTNRLNLLQRDRFGPVLGYGARFFGGILKLGGAVQYMSVANYFGAVQNASTTAINENSLVRTGSGVLGNAGVTLTIPYKYLPSFSFVARDIGNPQLSNAPFILSDTNRRPSSITGTFDAGFSMIFKFSEHASLRLAADFRDAFFMIDDKDVLRRTFVGSEFSLFKLLHFRFGFGDGYPSAGFALSTKKASLEAAFYANQLGTTADKVKDQRFVLQYRWGLF